MEVNTGFVWLVSEVSYTLLGGVSEVGVCSGIHGNLGSAH